jgi:hypothetical protein
LLSAYEWLVERERNQRWLEGSLDATLIEDEASQDKMAWETDVPAAELVAQLAVQRAALDALRPELEALRAKMDAVWPPGRAGENGSVSVGVAGAEEAAPHAALAARMAASAAAGRRASSRPHATAPLPPGGFTRRYNVSFLLQYYKQPANIDVIVDALFNCTTDASLPPGTSAELIVNADSRGDAAAWEAAMARTNKNANGTSSFLSVLLSDNLHEVHGYNRAAAVARGEVLLLLQDDSQPPGSCAWLADVLDKFRAFPRLGALGALRSHVAVARWACMTAPANGAGLKVGEFWFPNSAYAPAGTDGVCVRSACLSDDLNCLKDWFVLPVCPHPFPQRAPHAAERHNVPSPRRALPVRDRGGLQPLRGARDGAGCGGRTGRRHGAAGRVRHLHRL